MGSECRHLVIGAGDVGIDDFVKPDRGDEGKKTAGFEFALVAFTADEKIDRVGRLVGDFFFVEVMKFLDGVFVDEVGAGRAEDEAFEIDDAEGDFRDIAVGVARYGRVVEILVGFIGVVEERNQNIGVDDVVIGEEAFLRGEAMQGLRSGGGEDDVVFDKMQVLFLTEILFHQHVMRGEAAHFAGFDMRVGETECVAFDAAETSIGVFEAVAREFGFDCGFAIGAAVEIDVVAEVIHGKKAREWGVFL